MRHLVRGLFSLASINSINIARYKYLIIRFEFLGIKMSVESFRCALIMIRGRVLNFNNIRALTCENSGRVRSKFPSAVITNKHKTWTALESWITHILHSGTRTLWCVFFPIKLIKKIPPLWRRRKMFLLLNGINLEQFRFISSGN